MFRRKRDATDEQAATADDKQKDAPKQRSRMSAQVVEHREKAERASEARVETAGRLVHELLEGAAAGNGIPGLIGTPPTFLEGLTNIHISVAGQFEQAPTVVSRWTVHGDHTRELLGAAPTWREINVNGVMILTIGNDGEIQRGWIYWDVPGVIERLGLSI
jgi:hypothetical protein